MLNIASASISWFKILSFGLPYFYIRNIFCVFIVNLWCSVMKTTFRFQKRIGLLLWDFEVSLRRKSRYFLLLTKTIWNKSIIELIFIETQGILVIPLLVILALLKIMIIHFIGQCLQLDTNLTDFPQKSWLYFISFLIIIIDCWWTFFTVLLLFIFFFVNFFSTTTTILFQWLFSFQIFYDIFFVIELIKSLIRSWLFIEFIVNNFDSNIN